MPVNSPNINILWSRLIIEELLRNGVEYFCLASGSRSAPLAVALSQTPQAKSFIHYDERGLGFHAVGYAAAARKPAALITTSGTAVANLFPALIEAGKKKLPLIVLTADRPPELRHTGANQTIDQVKMFGDTVRFYFDMPCPTEDIPPEVVLTTIDQAVFRARGELPGPVHINCMFREPLAPVETRRSFRQYLKPLKSWLAAGDAYTRYRRGETHLPEPVLEEILTALGGIQNGVIAVGKLSSSEDENAVLALSQQLNWPVFPDISSGLRLGHPEENIIPHFDQILLSEKFIEQLPVDGVLQVGGRMTSKRWTDLIKKKQPRHHIMVLNHPLRNDPAHTVSLRIQSGIASFCSAIIPGLPQRAATPSLARLQGASETVSTRIEKSLYTADNTLSEPAVCRMISELIPRDTALFLANSMPIRDMDMFASAGHNPVRTGANRGASGIDGTIASAVGFTKGHGTAGTLIIGDLALLHDINSLMMTKSLSHPLVIVVLNNDGGGIFSFLPIAQFKNAFEKYFGTPHGLTFAHAARLFGLAYDSPRTQTEFQKNYESALKRKKSTIIEIKTVRGENHTLHQRLQDAVRRAVDGTDAKRPSAALFPRSLVRRTNKVRLRAHSGNALHTDILHQSHNKIL